MGTSAVGPRVSVVVPTYNSERFVAETLRSLADQTSQDWELVVVDDASCDGTVELLRSILAELARAFPQRSMQLHCLAANGGVAAARNVGVSSARGEYVLPLDADDMIDPTALQRCLASFDADPGLDLVFPDRWEFGDVERYCEAGAFELDRLKYFNRLSYCAMFRRDRWEALGGYRADVSGFDDWDLWIRAAAAGWRAHHVAAPLLRHRRHPASQMRTALARYEELFARIIVFNRGLYPPEQVAEAERMVERGEAGPFLRSAGFVFRRAFTG